MRPDTLALSAALAVAASSPFADAFTPVSTSVVTRSISYEQQVTSSSSFKSPSTNLSMSSFLGMDDDDEDEDEDEDDYDDDDELATAGRYSGAKSPFTGLKLDPWDPNPIIKPRPSRYFDDKETSLVPDDQLVQTMTPAERKENLEKMRSIRKNDLPDLRMRKDHAGWVEANNDLKKRYAKDVWFGVNERLREASQLGKPEEEVQKLKDLANKVGGPPEGITLGPRGFAVHTEIYDIGISASRAASILEREMRLERAAQGRAMMAERKKNIEAEQRQFEEDMRNPGVREDKEAKERRERVMRRLMAEIEEDNKKKMERAKEILGKVPETPESRTSAMKKALDEAREEVKKARREELGKAAAEGMLAADTDDDEVGSRPKSSADIAREAAAAEAAGGRPRLPGDEDVTRGELGNLAIESSSSAVTGPLTVEVSSTYNKEQSDPPMRKHCFQYTIRITNNSPTDTIQLLGRRFEIQTVGSSMKDVVQGEGVTGRQPILKPGEVFEYTSTAPLSVRPIGTTIIAARMKGEYRYVVLSAGQETATPEQVEAGGNATAELGTFHFIFPKEQRVTPFTPSDADDDDEEDDDEDETEASADSVGAAFTKAAADPAPAATPAASTPAAAATPASTLPGDSDMISGNILVQLNDASDVLSDGVRVQVTSSYRPERSEAGQDKHCFAYNIRITNESDKSIQLVSRRFEIQTIGSQNKDVVQGPGVTGRQPILKPGESFEYTSTAPLSVKPMMEKTPVVARMQGEYNFVKLSDDGTTPISSTPLQAKLGSFHFILPALDIA